MIRVFTTETCPTCKAEKAWLAENGIEYQEFPLEDVEVQALLRELEQRLQRRLSYVPITVVGDQIFEGFDPDQFSQLLVN